MLDLQQFKPPEQIVATICGVPAREYLTSGDIPSKADVRPGRYSQLRCKDFT